MFGVSSIYFFVGFAFVAKMSWCVTGKTPFFYECASNADCEHGECCFIGMQRFSIPTCAKYGVAGDSCIKGNVAKNATVTYPNGASIDLVNVYTLFCPCDPQSDLVCSRGSCGVGGQAPGGDGGPVIRATDLSENVV